MEMSEMHYVAVWGKIRRLSVNAECCLTQKWSLFWTQNDITKGYLDITS